MITPEQAATIIISVSFAIFIVTFVSWVILLIIKKVKTRRIIEKTIRIDQEHLINKENPKK